MPLDVRIQTFMEQTGLLIRTKRTPGKPDELLAELRANAKKTILTPSKEMESVVHIENRLIPGAVGNIPIRIYTPIGNGPFPILVSFHGGGWVTGNLETDDIGCRYFCYEAGCLVLSVDYHLPPEYRFPIGLEDCYTATCWIAAHAAQFQGDSSRIAVGGASGGGNFAASIALMSRDRGGPALIFQLLIVPVIDFRVTTSSWKDFDGYMMTKEDFLIARDFYLSSEQDQWHPYAAPSFAPDLRGLPSTLIITAECDPVRDGGEQYGQQLIEAGVPTTISRYDSMPHGFMGMRALVPDAGQALSEASRTLRAAFFSNKK